MQKSDDTAGEIRRLFAELRETYARASHLQEGLVSDTAASGRLTEERAKASALIARIRELQKF